MTEKFWPETRSAFRCEKHNIIFRRRCPGCMKPLRIAIDKAKVVQALRCRAAVVSPDCYTWLR